MASRGFVLGVLIANGVFEPGLDKLSCCVGGVEYHAELGPNGEIWFEDKVFKSPSAFSVHVKRKINPTRKADDGWTSVRYKGEVLSSFRSQLEQLLSAGAAGGGVVSNGIFSYGDFACNSASSGGSPQTHDPLMGGGSGVVAAATGSGPRQQKRKGRPKSAARDRVWSDEDADDAAFPGRAPRRQGPRTTQRGKRSARYPSAAAAQRRISLPGEDADERPVPQRRNQQQQQQRAHQSQQAVPFQQQQRRRQRDQSPADDRAFSDQQQYCWEAMDEQQYEEEYDQGEEEGQAGAYTQADLAYTWVQCTRPLCAKWRRVPAGQSRRSFVCEHNPLPGFQDCAAPQELPDEQVACLLDDESAQRHVAASNRPPLARCNADAFEEDLALFLMGQGEEGLATLVREHRIMCNNLPLDLFGLYREVVARGGMLDNERYDERGRWVGGINFAGEVFPRIRNYTPNNRATSVGNQLLNNYKKFLTRYERAWRLKDMPHAGPPPPLTMPSPGQQQQQQVVVKTERGAGGQRMQRHSTSPLPDPLALLADIANAGSDDNEGHAASAPPGAVALEARVGSCDGPLPFSLPRTQHERKRRRTDDGNGMLLGSLLGGDALMEDADVDGMRGGELDGTAAGAAAAAGAGERRSALSQLLPLCQPSSRALGRYPPGSLLLAQDPRDLSSHWAVVVADASELPASVAAGGVAGSRADGGFPQTMREASASGSDALPVLLLGTDLLGWVEASACRAFSATAGQSAAASAWAAIGRDKAGAVPADGPLRDGQHELLPCIRGLKMALQLLGNSNTSGLHMGPHAANTASNWVRAAATAATSARLLSLEGQLASGALCNGGAAFWEVFRNAVRGARSPHELAPQVLMLAYQVEPELLRADAADAMWDDMQELLGMCAGSSGGGAAAAALAGGQAGLLPSCLSVDAAVGVLEEAIDWGRARAVWSAAAQVPVQQLLPQQLAYQHERRQHSQPRDLGQQQQQAEQQAEEEEEQGEEDEVEKAKLEQEQQEQPDVQPTRSSSGDDLPHAKARLAAAAADNAATLKPAGSTCDLASITHQPPAAAAADTLGDLAVNCTAEVSAEVPADDMAALDIAAATASYFVPPAATASIITAAAALMPASGARPPRAPVVMRAADGAAVTGERSESRLHAPAAIVSEARQAARTKKLVSADDDSKKPLQQAHAEAANTAETALADVDAAAMRELAGLAGGVFVQQGNGAGFVSAALPTPHEPLADVLSLLADLATPGPTAAQQHQHQQQQQSRQSFQQHQQQHLQLLQAEQQLMAAPVSEGLQLRELSFKKLLTQPLNTPTLGSPFALGSSAAADPFTVGSGGIRGASFTFDVPVAQSAAQSLAARLGVSIPEDAGALDGGDVMRAQLDGDQAGSVFPTML